MKFFTMLLLPGMFIFSVFSTAQQTKPAPAPAPEPPARLITPEVHSDNSVTFRFRAPNAKEVKLDLEGSAAVAMQKDDAGIWTVNTAPLPADYYGYSILVDDVRSLDPENSGLVPNLLSLG